MRLLEFPFYPFVLFILFPVQFYAANTGIFDGLSVVRLVAFLTALCGLFLGILWLVTRSRDFAACALAISVVIFFIFAPMPVVIAGIYAGAALVGYAVNNLGLTRPLVVIANVASTSLLIVPVSQIVLAEVFSARTAAEPLQFGPIADLGSDAFAGRPAPPSVVHIVLDAYGGRTALKNLFGYDNTPFSDALRDLGFVVMEDVPVPYNQTLLSMSAVMNADFPPLESPLFSEMDDNNLRVLLSQTVIEGAVIRRFRDLGHEIAYTVTGYNAFQYPEYARLVSTPTEMIELSLFDVYFLLHRLDKWGVNLLEPAQRASPLDLRMKGALSLSVVDKLKPPFFLYSHVLAPHPPFTTDRNGNSTSRWGFSLMADGDLSLADDKSLEALYREGYLEKLRFVNDAVLSQTERMINAIEGPMIVIIHGDHGSGYRFINESAERTCLMERMRTTVAIYSNVAEIRDAVVAGEIDNTINIYRTIFAALLGTEIPPAGGQYFAKWSAPNQPQSLAGADFDRNCAR
jgi:hypothetical protein